MQALLSSLYTRIHRYTEQRTPPEKRKIHTAEEVRGILFNQQANIAACMIEDTISGLENLGLHKEAILRGISRAMVNLREARDAEKKDD